MTATRGPVRVICLTPVRNEAWILRQFLSAVSLWADNIIVADQDSQDGSREIARSFPKVTLVANELGEYQEGRRQQLLLSCARQFPGPKILVSLDADEFLSPILANKETMAKIESAGPGAWLRVPWLNVAPGLDSGWIGHGNFIGAWYDDGRDHTGIPIHSERLPIRGSDFEVNPIDGACVMHWQYTAPDRMRSKHRWYLAWERLHHPAGDPVQLYRQYHHMDAITTSEFIAVPREWLDWYAARGVELNTIQDDQFHWWDGEILKWLALHGARAFRRDAIWGFNWRANAERMRLPEPARYADPRNALQKGAHKWLSVTQRRHKTFLVRSVDRVLRSLL